MLSWRVPVLQRHILMETGERRDHQGLGCRWRVRLSIYSPFQIRYWRHLQLAQRRHQGLPGCPWPKSVPQGPGTSSWGSGLGTLSLSPECYMLLPPRGWIQPYLQGPEPSGFWDPCQLAASAEPMPSEMPGAVGGADSSRCSPCDTREAASISTQWSQPPNTLPPKQDTEENQSASGACAWLSRH